VKAEEYAILIRAFLNKEIPVHEFERRYLTIFKGESGDMDISLFRILDALFGAVDSYSPDCPPGEETAFLISEEQFRREATSALTKLVGYLETLPNDGV
jgi:hypothetical protein